MSLGAGNHPNSSVTQLNAIKAFYVSNPESLRLAVIFLSSFILWNRECSAKLVFNERSTGKSYRNSDC